MVAFLLFVLKSSLVLALLVSLFMAFMSRETFHRLNRFLLLGIVVCSLVLPMVNIGIESPFSRLAELLLSKGEVQQEGLSVDELAMLPLGEFTMDTLGEAVPVTPIDEKTPFDWVLLLLVVYVAGVSLLLARQLFIYLQLVRMIKRGRCVDASVYGCKGIELRVHSGNEKPFSWFGWVVVSQEDMGDGVREILIHETAHINAGHSWDILFVDAVVMLQWFNPLAWVMKNCLKDIHEFEADEAVLNSGVNAKEYQLLIIKKAVGARSYSIANSFNHSLTKRITMMCKEKSRKWRCAKALYILPVAAVVALSFSTVENVNAVENETVFKGNEIVANDTIKIVKKEPAEVVYQIVEQQPQFPGGEKEMYNYLMNSIKYPADAKKAGKEGRAFVQFVVCKDGMIDDVRLVGTAGDEAFDNEALRVVRSMPKWIPGKQGGENVNVKLVLPIYFTLNTREVLDVVEAHDSVIVIVDGKRANKPLKEMDARTFERIEVLQKNEVTSEMRRKYNLGENSAVMLVTTIKKGDALTTLGLQDTQDNVESTPSDMAILVDDAYLKKTSTKSVPVIFNEEISDVSAIVVNGALHEANLEDIDVDKIESIVVKKIESLTGEELEKCKQLGKKAVVYITLKKDDSKPSEAIFYVCENAPEFPGGMQAMMTYLQSNIRYPKVARDLKTQGWVIVQFVVRTDGTVSDAKVIKTDYKTTPDNSAVINRSFETSEKELGNSIDDVVAVAYDKADGNRISLDEVREQEKIATKALEDEALRLVTSMPKWIPGMQSGKPVNVQFTLPVQFKLQ